MRPVATCSDTYSRVQISTRVVLEPKDKMQIGLERNTRTLGEPSNTKRSKHAPVEHPWKTTPFPAANDVCGNQRHLPEIPDIKTRVQTFPGSPTDITDSLTAATAAAATTAHNDSIPVLPLAAAVWEPPMTWPPPVCPAINPLWSSPLINVIAGSSDEARSAVGPRFTQPLDRARRSCTHLDD